MKEVYTLIRKSNPDTTGIIFEADDFRINYIGLTDTGMETYLLLTDTLHYALRYDRDNDAFYQQEWVKIEEHA